MRTLILDIETSPNVAHVWGLWQQNVSISQLRQSSFTLCWAAKWRGENRVYFRDHRDPQMIPEIAALLDKADAVVTYNGDNFDLPTLRKDILLAGIAPPSPANSIDLYRVVKRKFRFPSLKLEYVSKALGLDGKVQHPGHDLWIGVLAGDDKAWRLMKRYNIQDVRLNEQLLEKLEPWIDTMPNWALYVEGDACPRCGTRGELKREGYAYTRLGKYQRYRCGACGGWSRESKRENGVEVQAAL